ncbi:hypothetical protein GQ600_21364 [Phytophthora cactorum]|nr:hypothetical protein GQ600_21364 [Phytophthora cactorum]
MKRRVNLTVRSVNGLVRGPGSNCYFRLYEHLSPDDDDLEDFIPSRSAHRSLHQLVEELRDVESISKKLQTDGLTMLDTRDLLDGMLEVHQPPDAPFVHSPKFESAIVKVLGGKENRAAAISTWAPVAAPAAEQEDPSFAERILKRRKVDAAPVLTLCWLPSRQRQRGGAAVQLGTAVLRHERHRSPPWRSR